MLARTGSKGRFKEDVLRGGNILRIYFIDAVHAWFECLESGYTYVDTDLYLEKAFSLS